MLSLYRGTGGGGCFHLELKSVFINVGAQGGEKCSAEATAMQGHRSSLLRANTITVFDVLVFGVTARVSVSTHSHICKQKPE